MPGGPAGAGVAFLATGFLAAFFGAAFFGAAFFGGAFFAAFFAAGRSMPVTGAGEITPLIPPRPGGPLWKPMFLKGLALTGGFCLLTIINSKIVLLSAAFK